MNFVRTIHTLPSEIKNIYRKIEKNENKLLKNKWSLIFNETCLKEEILPNYTKIRLHDPAAANNLSTRKYRVHLIKNEVTKRENTIKWLKDKISSLRNQLNLYQVAEQLKTEVEERLIEHLTHSEIVIKTRIHKKLNNLYDGKILLKFDSDAFINLSDHTLTNDQKKFLNLGINCHLPRKYNKLEKKTELEILYQNLLSI